MDACNAVEREVDRVLSKFGGINEHASRTLSGLITYIENLKKEYDATPEDHELSNVQVDLLKQAMTKVKETVTRLATDHRDSHSTVSKVGKAIDRNFVSDFAATSRDDVFNTSEKLELLNKVICQHYHRHGYKDVAEELAAEAGISPEFNNNEPFTELNHILESLKQKDIEPALAWAIAHRDNLEAHNSSLEFKLHQFKFIEILLKGPSSQNDAITYARMHFRPFAYRHAKEIQTLMGMILYLQSGVKSSPYQLLFTTDRWVEIYDTFTRDACLLLGVSVNSPLSICVNAGCIAIPALLNIKQIMKDRQVAGIWNGKDELPIEIDLGSENRYHSMFACPILRQQSTESNPPMRLICGHVISRDALNKLCSGNKMKCPYCPMEQSPADAKLIYF
ncbi:macrophage erythroblast attacher-related [Holotrichia oblita]|uniref:Macrophage erythroblast attacher-related n=1 Tax=Holotrichia oblita TaxID=644536 RepID=A0ACB9SYZ0_HOLOL|nr:macrophage erythroblast attacher-related [Holotrichia oblita]